MTPDGLLDALLVVSERAENSYEGDGVTTVLHVHRVPAAVYHALPYRSRFLSEDATCVWKVVGAKRVRTVTVEINAFCEHRGKCPDLPSESEAAS